MFKKIFRSRCYNGGSRHNFSGRYSERPAGLEFESVRCSSERLRSLMYYRVYKHDVCNWCGKVVKKHNI